MIIRPEQMKALSKVPELAFEDEMVAHLEEFSPALFKVLKEDQMRKVVRLGIDRSSEYGLTLRGPIRLYLELMLLFGSHFETDPQYPWANEILAARDTATEMQRAESLFEKTLDYQKRVSGPEAVNTRKALSEFSVLAAKPVTLSAKNLVADIREEMTRVFPQKATYVGEAGLEVLIRKGITEASKYHFPLGRGEALLGVLMFAFGHGCTSDPLYPWIARTLKDEKIIDPAARAERLEKKAVTWVEHVLTWFGEGVET